MKLTTTRLRQIIKEELNRMSRTPSRRLKESRDWGDFYNPKEEGAALRAAKKYVNSGMLPPEVREYLESGDGEIAIGLISGRPMGGMVTINLRAYAVTPAEDGYGWPGDTYTSDVGASFSIGAIGQGVPTPVSVEVTPGMSGEMSLTPEGRMSIAAQLGDLAGFAWLPQLGELIKAPGLY